MPIECLFYVYRYFNVIILIMSNRINKQVMDNIKVIPTIPQKNRIRPKPKPKHEFTKAARHGLRLIKNNTTKTRY